MRSMILSAHGVKGAYISVATNSTRLIFFRRPSVSGLRKHWCPEIVDLIELMWQHDYDERPDMNEVVEELERLVQQYR